MNLENTTVADFTLKNQNNEDVNINQFRGKKVVIFFYPKDNTPGCTLEAQGFRDLQEQFKEINTVILGISKDTPNDHCTFIADFNLNFDLLCDTDLSVAKKLEAIGEGSLIGLTSRSTLIINEDGLIIKHYKEAGGNKEHSKEVYDFLKSYKK